MSFKVVIPARYGSTRLPAKALLDIAGRPMIQWVIDAALRSGAGEVLVATDDVRVAEAAVHHAHPGKHFGVLTSDRHQSGTDRIAEVAQALGWSADIIVVNVQGDEPQLPPALIDQVAALLAAHPEAEVATLCTPVESLTEFLDPNVVKVVTDANGVALYFSRAPIPWSRDTVAVSAGQTSFAGAQRHLGIYAYRVRALKQLTAMPPSELELIERLEQLRALQAGLRIAVEVAAIVPGTGVDTEHDLARVRKAIENRD